MRAAGSGRGASIAFDPCTTRFGRAPLASRADASNSVSAMTRSAPRKSACATRVS